MTIGNIMHSNRLHMMAIGCYVNIIQIVAQMNE